MAGADDLEVIEPSDDDLRAAFDAAVAYSGVTWEELQAQGRVDRFSSDAAEYAWFIASSIAPHLPTGG